MYRNAEHYYCPTEGLAIAHVMEEERKKRKRKQADSPHWAKDQAVNKPKKKKKAGIQKPANYQLVWTDTEFQKEQKQLKSAG